MIIMKTKEFPTLDGGWCDGQGCGACDLCFCGMFLDSKIEYQKKFNKPWKRNTNECKIWEESFRHSFNIHNKDYIKTREQNIKNQFRIGEIYSKDMHKIESLLVKYVDSDTVDKKDIKHFDLINKYWNM